MKAILGIDTSCYTTSAALADEAGNILASARKLLEVPEGERGLQQSSGLFQHVKQLPVMIGKAVEKAGPVQVAAVAASTKPRQTENSYMPVFRAGESQARSAAALLGVPFYPFSHQEGHVRAAMVDAEIDASEPFLTFHLSGGTTEMLLCKAGSITCIGGSRDLHAGQLLDRVGVKLGFGFPAGPEMEKLAMRGRAQGLIGVSIKGCDCCIPGAENRADGFIRDGMPREQIAAELFDFLVRTIERMMEEGCRQTGCRQALLAGGVSSSLLFREMLRIRAGKRRLACSLHFAHPELSGDNAVGIALLGADKFRTMREENL